MPARNTLVIGGIICVAVAAGMFSLGFETSSSRPVNVRTGKGGAARDQKAVAFSIEKQVSAWEKELPVEVQKTMQGYLSEGQPDGLKKAAFLADSAGAFGLSGYYLYQLAEKSSDTTTWIVASSRLLNAASRLEDAAAAWCLTQAGKASARVLSIDPNNQYGKNIQAEVILRTGDDSRVMEAVSLLKDVLKSDAENLMALENLGMLQMRSGQWDKAAGTYRKLVKIQAANPEYYVHLSDVELALGHPNEAKNLLEKAIPLIKDADIRKNIEQKLKEIN